MSPIECRNFVGDFCDKIRFLNDPDRINFLEYIKN